MISSDSKIYIAGHKGMVGSAIFRDLKHRGFSKIIYKSSKELDLRNQKLVYNFIKKEKPSLIINAAAVVGGIFANSKNPYKFILENMQIQNNLISASVSNEIKNFIFLGSSCIYPKFAKQPLKEKYILTLPLEESNQWYAVAKISGIKLMEAVRKQFGYNYISLMPTNLYGPNDNFDPFNSHVLPGMISKFYNAILNKDSKVLLWGDGTPLREFLHVDDLARAVYFIINNSLENEMYNVGSEDEISILNLANKIKHIIGFRGEIIWDKSYPNGTPRKKLDNSKLYNLGWKPKISLDKGIRDVINNYINDNKR